LFGYAPDEAAGRSVNDLIAPEGLRAEAEGPGSMMKK
jgi:hypothetical protein